MYTSSFPRRACGRFLKPDHMGEPPLKIKMLKIVFVLARHYKKIDLEPNFHEPKSSHGGYLRGQSKRAQFPILHWTIWGVKK